MSIKRPSPYQLSRTLGSLLILAASSFAADGALADNKGRDDVVIATPLGATGKVALQGQLVRVVDPSAANCAPAPDFSALAVIELDDRSHNREPRREQDQRKDAFVQAAGLKMIRVSVADMPNEAALKALMAVMPAASSTAQLRDVSRSGAHSST